MNFLNGIIHLPFLELEFGQPAAWSDSTDVQTSLDVYSSQRLITFGFSRISVKKCEKACISSIL